MRTSTGTVGRMLKQAIAVTRVVNSCVLLELDGHAVLTDPWFTERWFLRRGEPLGLRVAELPPLAAIVVTNPATNH
jgi:L-ascorbate metabolism protein UlaG (beta-lactamase superfamily)